MLGGRYAGRFPIGIGRDNPRLEGSYTVKKKLADPRYFGPDRTIEPGDPTNPLGRFSLELADRVAIHGTDEIKNLRRADGRGTICLGPRDIEDLYNILTAGSESAVASKVTVQR
jgi:lipoprotein-anchoring transpeptidase ErfK/SrfK